MLLGERLLDENLLGESVHDRQQLGVPCEAVGLDELRKRIDAFPRSVAAGIGLLETFDPGQEGVTTARVAGDEVVVDQLVAGNEVRGVVAVAGPRRETLAVIHRA